MEVVVYIPVFNNIDWCRAVRLVPAVRYVASDNCSTDGSGQALRDRGVTVIRHDRNLGRVGNWAFCVQHFIDSGASWMKWLFAGDVLASNFAEVAMRAVIAYPAARMIIGDNIHLDADYRAYYKVMSQTRLLQPAESLELLARKGNWFYSPINQMFHRDALTDGFDFGPFSWGADVYFCMNVATRVPVLYWAESFGEFNVSARAFFSAHGESLRALLETALVREMAASRLEDMTGDVSQHAALSLAIEADVLRRLGSRRLGRTRSGTMVRTALRTLRRIGTRREPAE